MSSLLLRDFELLTCPSTSDLVSFEPAVERRPAEAERARGAADVAAGAAPSPCARARLRRRSAACRASGVGFGAGAGPLRSVAHFRFELRRRAGARGRARPASGAVPTSRDSSHGFSMKSRAPRRIASSASSIELHAGHDDDRQRRATGGRSATTSSRPCSPLVRPLSKFRSTSAASTELRLRGRQRPRRAWWRRRPSSRGRREQARRDVDDLALVVGDEDAEPRPAPARAPKRSGGQDS